MKNWKKKWFLKKLIKQKEKGKLHLELDLDFIQRSYKDVFQMSEDELREKLAEAKKKKQKKTAAKLEIQLNKYNEVKRIFIKTQSELELITKYVFYLKDIK